MCHVTRNSYGQDEMPQMVTFEEKQRELEEELGTQVVSKAGGNESDSVGFEKNMLTSKKTDAII